MITITHPTELSVMVVAETPYGLLEDEQQFDHKVDAVRYARGVRTFLFFQGIESLMLDVGKSLAPLNSFDRVILVKLYKEYKYMIKISAASEREFSFYKAMFDEKMKSGLEKVITQASAQERFEEFKTRFKEICEL